MSFMNLPRDIQLSIIRRFDIDTRIKTSVIGRLQVPDLFLTKLTSILHAHINAIKIIKETPKDDVHILTTTIYENDDCKKSFMYYFDMLDNVVYWGTRHERWVWQ